MSKENMKDLLRAVVARVPKTADEVEKAALKAVTLVANVRRSSKGPAGARG
jgi:hypothetical protein